MIKATLKFLLLLLLVLFTVALINPLKAVYIVNIVSAYTYVATSTIGMNIVELALKLRSLNVG